MSINIQIFLLLLIGLVNKYSYGLAESNYKYCRERNRLIETKKDDLYSLIDATLGQKLTLQCHYCNEVDDERPKIWYKIDEIGGTHPHEVRLDMKNNATNNAVDVTLHHSLIIHEFSANDTGFYYCQRLEQENENEKFNYLVDLIFHDNQTELDKGNETDWRKFYDEYFMPINTLFNNSKGSEFVHVREKLNLGMEMVTQWRSWGPCEVCGRPNNTGIKEKIGDCRIKLTQKISSKSAKSDESFLINSNAIACRSQLLSRVLPGISNITRVIPSFIQVHPCEGICNPDVEGLGKGWKAGKKFAYKYRRTVVLDEDSHLTLICPESSLENSVSWKRNGKVLKPGKSLPEDDPRMLVDTFNTLYLINVKRSEAGNYTCEVDDIKMQQVIIYIVNKSRILNDTFVRYLIYLGIILLLVFPFYCAGVVIACSRSRKFKGYTQLQEEDKGNRGARIF